MTHFAENAVGERDKLGWCRPCWQMREKYHRQGNDGKEYWVEPRDLYDDGRGRRPPTKR